jgi:hypothetical protein
MSPVTTNKPALRTLALTGAVLALAAAFSCKTFDLPNETCNPQDLDANRLRGEGASGECSTCLEERCCDKIGVCERKGGCADIVRGVHDCVLKAGLQGAEEERRCAQDHKLTSQSEANDAYRCMRDNCGERCGLPVCRVNQAAVLVATPACDRCFSSSCCPELNSCYGSRACKLMIECIATECRDVLGPSLVMSRSDPDFGGPPPDAADGPDIKQICAPGAPPSELGAPPCVRDCLCRYVENDQGLAPEDVRKQPFTLAASIYQCAVRADCGPKCLVSTDAGGD